MIVCIFLCWLIPWSAFAQTIVKGKVVDKDNLPIPSATVTEKGTTNVTSTNEKGDLNANASSKNRNQIDSLVSIISTLRQK